MIKKPSYDELSVQVRKLSEKLEVAEKALEANCKGIDNGVEVEQLFEARIAEQEKQYDKLFNDVNVSIWNEDISEIYDALEQLREQGIEDLRTYIQQQSEDLLQEFVSKVRILCVNEATIRLFKATSESHFLGQISEVFGDNAMEVFVEELCAIWDKKSCFNSMANLIALDGTKIKTIISFKIPTLREDFKNIPITFLDISEFKYQEDHFNAVIEALPDVTFVLDEDGRYIDISTSRHDLLYDDLQNLKGQLIHDIIPEETADFFVETINKTISSGEKHIVEYELNIPQGVVWFEGRVTPMLTTFNDKKAVVWIAVDITEHKKIETQLRQAQKMEAIGILTGGIAHEFNNLLSPILGFSDLIMNNTEKNDPDYSGLLQILKAGERAKILVQQLLAYSRQSMSRKEKVHLAVIVKEAMLLLKNAVPANITFREKIASDLPSISGMPNEIHQVIFNLCINASHAMPDGGELFISLQQKQPKQQPEDVEEHDFICLTVRDNGVGMEIYTIERIFDPFFTTKDIGAGSGLGLSVVQGIVEQHNGMIEVESKTGEGTSFLVYFPIIEQEHTIEKTTNRSLLQGDEHIMLVDDEPMTLNISKRMLEKLEYNISDFSDCELALQQFKENPDAYDLIITDYGMPKMNGKQFSEKVKLIRSDIPIILSTGYGDLITRENISLWGMDDMLIKPFAIKELSTMIRSVLENLSSG